MSDGAAWMISVPLMMIGVAQCGSMSSRAYPSVDPQLQVEIATAREEIRGLRRAVESLERRCQPRF